MARPQKIGLDYYPTDVGIVRDIKVQKLLRYHKGPAALGVLIALFSLIYDHGYYLDWDDDQKFVLSKDLYVNEDYIQEIIDACLGIGIFDSDLYNAHKILTSHGIQQRYVLASQRRRVEIHTLPHIYPSILKKELSKHSAKGELMPTETEIMHTDSTQSKVKKRKEDIDSSLRSESSSSATTSDGSEINFLAFMDFFNRTMQENGAQIPTITDMTLNRCQAVRARAKEYTKEALRKAVINAATAPFLNGAGDKAWVADFNWIFRPVNFVKVLEGTYNHGVVNQNSIYHGTENNNGYRSREDMLSGTIKVMSELRAEGSQLQEPLPIL